MKKVTIIFIIFFIFSCSQEQLIFFRNLKRVDFDPIKQLFIDIGLEKMEVEQKEKIKSDDIEKGDFVVAKKVPVENKILRINVGDSFTLKISVETNFVVLKSIEGDTVFNSNDSKIEMGVYVFKAGNLDSKVKFDVLDLDGVLIKRLFYFVNVLRNTNNITDEKKGTVGQKPRDKVLATNVQTNQTEEKITIGVKGILEGIKKNMPYAEAIKEYENIIKSENISEGEKDETRYYLIDLLLERKNFEKAERVIKDISNEGRRLYYLGKSNNLRKKEKEAYIFYREALEKGDFETKKLVISSLLNLLKNNKLATLEEVDSMTKILNNFKQDKNFYASSMIDIAEIYIYFKKVYQSESILKSIIEGDYSEGVKKRAKEVYKDLREGFLDYK